MAFEWYLRGRSPNKTVGVLYIISSRCVRPTKQQQEERWPSLQRMVPWSRSCLVFATLFTALSLCPACPQATLTARHARAAHRLIGFVDALLVYKLSIRERFRLKRWPDSRSATHTLPPSPGSTK